MESALESAVNDRLSLQSREEWGNVPKNDEEDAFWIENQEKNVNSDCQGEDKSSFSLKKCQGERTHGIHMGQLS